MVISGIHRFHEQHRVVLSSAHGDSALERFLTEDRLDVAAAAQPNGLSARGFADVYQGPCVAIGALTAEPYPRPGVRADMPSIRAGLGDQSRHDEAKRLAKAFASSDGHGLLLFSWVRIAADSGSRARRSGRS